MLVLGFVCNQHPVSMCWEMMDQMLLTFTLSICVTLHEMDARITISLANLTFLSAARWQQHHTALDMVFYQAKVRQSHPEASCQPGCITDAGRAERDLSSPQPGVEAMTLTKRCSISWRVPPPVLVLMRWLATKPSFIMHRALPKATVGSTLSDGMSPCLNHPGILINKPSTFLTATIPSHRVVEDGGDLCSLQGKGRRVLTSQ